MGRSHRIAAGNDPRDLFREDGDQLSSGELADSNDEVIPVYCNFFEGEEVETVFPRDCPGKVPADGIMDDPPKLGLSPEPKSPRRGRKRGKEGHVGTDSPDLTIRRVPEATRSSRRTDTHGQRAPSSGAIREDPPGSSNVFSRHVPFRGIIAPQNAMHDDPI